MENGNDDEFVPRCEADGCDKPAVYNVQECIVRWRVTGTEKGENYDQPEILDAVPDASVYLCEDHKDDY